MDFQRISGENFLAEFDIVDAKEQGHLVGIGRLSHQNEICGLGSGLHSVYARENGGAGAVALENLPGRVHPEGGGDALAGYQLVDLVDQQHGGPVGNDLNDLRVVELPAFTHVCFLLLQ